MQRKSKFTPEFSQYPRITLDNKLMNPLLLGLQPYPFERLKALFADVTPNPAYRPISLGIGEPKHPTPALINEALCGNLAGLSGYPATAGEPRLREGMTYGLGW